MRLKSPVVIIGFLPSLLKAFQVRRQVGILRPSIHKRTADQFHRLHSSQHEDDIGALASPYVPLDSDPDFGTAAHKTNAMDLRSILNIAVPAIFPFLAFATYDEVASGWELLVELVSPKTWVAVDGGAYKARIIAPAINGVVVPAIAVLFATLTSTTISSLRQRQESVHRAINMEAGELRALECLLEAFPPSSVKNRARDYLIQYTSRIISESSPKSSNEADSVIFNPRRSMDSELNALIILLNEHVQQQGKVNEDDKILPHVLSEVFASVSKLREERQGRITALQSFFPALHYMVLGVLAFAECIAFLVETNQEILP